MVEQPLRCIKYDASGKCLEYAPTDILGDGTGTDFNAPAFVVEDPSSDFYKPAYVIGLFDLGSETKKMQALRPVTVEIAHLLVKYGQQVIAEAIATANQPWYKPDLPGKTSRAEVAEHLQWHVDNLTKYADQLALYPSGDDLKAWALRSFIESNSVEAGNARMGAAWVALWAEIRDALVRIPKETLKALGGAAGGLAEGVLGMPVWAIGLGAVAAVALAGTLAYTLRR